MNLRNLASLGSILAVGAVTLSACTAPPAEPSGEPAELTPVSIGVLAAIDTAPIYLGDSLGFFEEEGIDLDIQVANGGAAAIPGVTGGQFTFAFSNLVSVLVAQEKGLPIDVVANGVTATGDSESDFSAIVVPGDSPIETAADLEGATIGVNTLASIGDTTIRSLIDEAGGDPTSVTFVQIAFPDAKAAIESGQVDAAWILEPFLTSALAAGNRAVAYNYSAFDPELDIAVYIAGSETDEDLVARFKAAVDRSLVYAQDHPDEVRDIVGTYTQIPDEARAALVLPRFRPEFDLDAAQKLGDAAFAYGTLTVEPDLETILP